MVEDEPLHHYVLVGRTGKQPGRLNHKLLALQLAAIDMTAQGIGGGLARLLLPNSDEQFEKLVKLVKRGYWFRSVKIRRTMRGDIRKAAVTDDLLVVLRALFAAEKKVSKRAKSAFVEEFSKWIAEKIATQDPLVTRLVSQAHYDLPNKSKSDWWKKQLNQKVKK